MHLGQANLCVATLVQPGLAQPPAVDMVGRNGLNGVKDRFNVCVMLHWKLARPWYMNMM